MRNWISSMGLQSIILVAPQDTEQALKKVEERFGEMFMRGMKDS